MPLEDIFAAFRKLESNSEKVEYLRWLESKDGFGYRINFETLISYWSNAK